MTGQIKRILIIIFLLAFCSTLGNLNRNGFFKEMSQPEKVVWKASWVRKSGDIKRQNFFFAAKRNFSLPFSPQEANLFISCQSRCKVFINDQLVQNVGLYSNPPYQYYDRLDISRFLYQGENVIDVLGYNEGVDTFSAPEKPDGLLVQIEVRNNWKKKIIVSDQQWKMAIPDAWDQKSKRIWKDYSGFEEIFNMERFFNNGLSAGQNDNRWEKAELIGRAPQKPWEDMAIRPIPYLQEKSVPIMTFQEGKFLVKKIFEQENIARFINDSDKQIDSRSIRDSTNLIGTSNRFISLKINKQITGGLRICFENNQTGIIDIGYAETLNENGVPDTGRMIFQGDRIINPTNNCWQSFHSRSFKYIILAFRDFPKPIKINSVNAIQSEYPAELKKPTISFNDPLLEKIYQTGIDTLKLDMQETFMDCPVRERAQYLGDSRVEALVAYSLFDDARLQKKMLIEFAQGQDSAGYFYSNYPTGHRVDIPTYTLQWVNMLWEYYEKTNDQKTLIELYPTLEKLLMFFSSLENESGLIANQPNWWIFIDHGSPIALGKYSLALQVSYYAAIADARKVAEALKKTNTAKRYEDQANRLKENINAFFWRSDSGFYDDCLEEKTYCNHLSQQANYWALYWDVVYDENRKILLKNLIQNKNNLTPSQTPFFNGFIVDVLFRYGERQEAIKLIKSYWGGMLSAGATTWWESFNPKTKSTDPHFGESMAHAWGSWPTYLLPKYLIGKPTPGVD